jgi:pimeloyl-ACP methyl ester carboxylesterase
METTVKFICDIVDRQEGQVILVGHSKNGVMISQVAELRPQKIEKLIYLAAYLIPNGRTQREYSMMDTKGMLKPFVEFDENKISTTLRPEIYREGLYHDCDEHIIELANLLLSAEPFETGIVPLELTEENFGSVPRYYIECTEDRAVTPFIQQKMYSEMPCRKIYRLASSHSPFFSMPEALCDIFCEIASDGKQIEDEAQINETHEII